jgi:hypothetical protein
MRVTKRNSREIVAMLRRIESLRRSGLTIPKAVEQAGVTEAEYRRWRTEFAGLLRTLDADAY